MKRLLVSMYRSIVAARQRKADELVLEHLDARTLRDIGLDDSAHADRLRSRARRDALRWHAALSPNFGGFR